MKQIVSWVKLEALIEPHDAKAGNGRRPVGLSIMLRTYFVQQWFNLSDPGVEEALDESPTLRRFVDVDSKSKLVHTVVTTAANVADCSMLPELLHGEERKVWEDGGYHGQGETIRKAAPQAQDMTCRRTKYKNDVDELQKKKNRSKSRVRAKVEHPFRILKRIFGFDKARYRGLKKNHHRLCACFALGNLYLHRKRLVPLGA